MNFSTPNARRHEVVAHAVNLLGVLYRWGGKTPAKGLDCSGLVTWCLARAGIIPALWSATHNSQALARAFPPAHDPRPGDLAFYGSSWDRVTHVMLVVGDGRVIGACGGGSTTLTPEDAMRIGASVKYRPRLEYRRDYLGCRRPPYPEDV